MPKGFTRVIGSSKVWTAAAAAIVVIASVLGVDAAKATKISAALVALATAVILATGYEDGQQKSAGGSNTPGSTSTGLPDATDALRPQGGMLPGNASAMLWLLLLLPLFAAGCAQWTAQQVAAEQSRYDQTDPLVKEHVASHPAEKPYYTDWQWSWQHDIQLHGGKAPTSSPIGKLISDTNKPSKESKVAKKAKSKPFPETIFIKRQNEGTEDEYLDIEMAEQSHADIDGAVRVAHYKLIGVSLVHTRIESTDEPN